MPPDHVIAPVEIAMLVDRVHRALIAGDPARAGDRGHVAAVVRREHPLLPASTLDAVADAVTARAVGLGPLEPILRDPTITEVMVNGCGPVWIERAGRLVPTDLHLSEREVTLLIERILSPLGLRADRVAPVADARLPDGSRVNVVVPPLAVDGPCITVRRFGARAIPLASLCPSGVAAFLSWALEARANIVVSGGTGAGKTTVLNALGAGLPPDERLVTVEDTAELRFPGPHVVRLEARPATADGLGAVGIRDLVRNALRMRPDRIVVGEVRGAEAIDMLWAMNTGHEGSLSTCHANSPLDALRRLEVMVLSAELDLPLPAVRDQLTAAVDLLVHVARLPGGGRGIVTVAEVIDDPDDPARVRLLADRDGLHALPERPPRRPDTLPPDQGWCR